VGESGLAVNQSLRLREFESLRVYVKSDNEKDRPVWLLDVDGVINVDKPGKAWSEAPFHATVFADVDFKLRWSPSLVRWISHLHSSGRVEVRWCTTWCPWTERLELALNTLRGLVKALSDEACFSSSRRVDEAKADVALAVWRSGRRLIWTDDTAITAAPGLQAQLTDGNRGLLISPNPQIGLTPDDVHKIDKFISLPS
jgi:hypothetical protein